MPIDPFSILILFGVTIVLGYIGSLIFDKTKIPDVAWLLIFGLLVGPVFNFVDRSIFIEASPLLSSIALLAILFDAGLHIDFHKLIKEIPRGLVLSILGVSFSVIGVSLALMVILRFDFWGAIILSTIIGGTSSASVVGMISALRISDEAKMALQLESIFTDPIVIVVAITFMQFAIAKVPLATLVNSLASAYSIAIVLGFIIGVIWLYALDELKKRNCIIVNIGNQVLYGGEGATQTWHDAWIELEQSDLQKYLGIYNPQLKLQYEKKIREKTIEYIKKRREFLNS